MASTQELPESRARAFHDLSEFPEFNNLTRSSSIIREEVHGNDLWMSWSSDNYDSNGKCLFLTGDWKVCPVYFGHFDPYSMVPSSFDRNDVDRLLASLPLRFPKTVALLERLPRVRYAAFSKLRPGCRLQPHRHRNPHSLIFHLGLCIPPGGTCGLRVDGRTHIWSRAGDAVIFDDNLEHSAWNDSDAERLILYVDFVRAGPAAS
jgi:hypothetical protein